MPEPHLDTPNKHVKIFGLEGQSMMVGGAGAPLASNVLAHDPDYTFIFTLGNQWWSAAFDPSHTTETAFGGSAYPSVWSANVRQGKSPAIAFLNTWTKINPDIVCGILPCAKSGTWLSEHMPGTDLYAAVTDRYQKAMLKGSVKAILFDQGQTDTRDPAEASQWSARFATLIAARRAVVGATVPVILFQIGQNPNLPQYPAWDMVATQQAQAASAVSNVILVRTRGLEYRVGDIHRTDDAQSRAGEAAAFALCAYT